MHSRSAPARFVPLFVFFFALASAVLLSPARAQVQQQAGFSVGLASEVDLEDRSVVQPQGHVSGALTAYSTSLKGNFAGQFVEFDLNFPQQLTPLDSSTVAYAGDFAPGETDSYFIIETDTSDDTGVSNDLVEVDRGTGETNQEGTIARLTPDETWTELAADPAGDSLFGSTATSSASFLYTVDPTTSTALRRAEVTLEDGSAVPGLIAAAFGPDGQLYGYEVESDSLLQIDKTDGTATVVGDIGFNANAAQGLDYSVEDSTMYMAAFNASTNTGQLRTVDLGDGSTSLVGRLGSGDQLGYLALPSTPTPTLAINEFLADPSDDGGGGVDLNGDGEIDSDDEFVEIINFSGEPIDIGGYQIDDEAGGGGSPYTFPDTTLADGEGATVIGNFPDGTDESQYDDIIGGDAGGFFDEGLPGLNNGGDDVRLLTADGTVVDSVSYGSNGSTAEEDGVSSARNPDGVGEFQLQNTFGPMTAETAGQDNTDGSALPVEFGGAPVATVEGSSGAVTLRWTTLSEQNNRGFYVQHRRDAASGEAAWRSAPERVDGAGTSTAEQRYDYTVTGLAPGAYVFRVKQVDTDGRASFSQTVEVEVGASGFSLGAAHPNPLRAGEAAQLDFSAPKGEDVDAALYNTLGQKVRTLEVGTGGGVIEVRPRGLSSGLYFVRLTSGDRTTTQAITLVR